MTSDELKRRTREFALRAIRLARTLDDDRVGRTIGNPLLRSASSVGANCRAACRARSSAEFRVKLGICEEEADESVYWIELLIDSGLVKHELLAPRLAEANELTAIIVASIKTSKGQ